MTTFKTQNDHTIDAWNTLMRGEDDVVVQVTNDNGDPIGWIHLHRTNESPGRIKKAFEETRISRGGPMSGCPVCGR